MYEEEVEDGGVGRMNGAEVDQSAMRRDSRCEMRRDSDSMWPCAYHEASGLPGRLCISEISSRVSSRFFSRFFNIASPTPYWQHILTDITLSTWCDT